MLILFIVIIEYDKIGQHFEINLIFKNSLTLTMCLLHGQFCLGIVGATEFTNT